MSNKIKLFTIPYAGGSVSIYNKWKEFLHDDIIMCPVELSGHGTRIKEDLYNSIEEAVDDIYNLIRKSLDDTNYALYGHSFGSLLAFEVAHRLVDNGIHEPSHIFFSGMNPPSVNVKPKNLYKLSDEEFLMEIFSLGGTPKELFEHKRLIKLFLPILKSDYSLFERYMFKTGRKKFDCDITVFSGEEDTIIDYEQIKKWDECTAGTCLYSILHGGHFFIDENYKYIVNMINNTLVYF